MLPDAPCRVDTVHHDRSCVCFVCTHNCPIGIDVRAHAWRGQAINSSYCLTCGECVKRCPRGVLSFELIPLRSKLKA